MVFEHCMETKVDEESEPKTKTKSIMRPYVLVLLWVFVSLNVVVVDSATTLSTRHGMIQMRGGGVKGFWNNPKRTIDTSENDNMYEQGQQQQFEALLHTHQKNQQRFEALVHGITGIICGTLCSKVMEISERFQDSSGYVSSIENRRIWREIGLSISVLMFFCGLALGLYLDVAVGLTDIFRQTKQENDSICTSVANSSSALLLRVAAVAMHCFIALEATYSWVKSDFLRDPNFLDRKSINQLPNTAFLFGFTVSPVLCIITSLVLMTFRNLLTLFASIFRQLVSLKLLRTNP